MADYQKRLVAFVDILGFKSMIGQVDAGYLEPEAISDILLTIRSNARVARRHFATNMSDSIVMSAPLTTGGLKSIIVSLEILTRRLLRSGIFLRGAVTVGSIFHNEHSVFGQGLIDAFQLESTSAIYPRILITDGLVKDINELKDARLRGSIRKGRHGKHYIHVLKELEEIEHTIITHRQTAQRRARYLSKYILMRNAIQNRANEAVGNSRHLSKVCWFARYWNSTAPKSVPELVPIKLPPQRARKPN
jgi:hypothetical protein